MRYLPVNLLLVKSFWSIRKSSKEKVYGYFQGNILPCEICLSYHDDLNPFAKSPTCFFNVIFMISRTFKIIHWIMFRSTLVLSLIWKFGPSFVPVFINVFSMSSGKWTLSGTLTWPTVRKEISIQKFFILTPKKQFSKQKHSSCSFKRNNNQTQSMKKTKKFWHT